MGQKTGSKLGMEYDKSVCYHSAYLFYMQSSVQLLRCLILCDPMDRSTPGLPVHHQLLVYPNSCPLSQWCHLTISSFVVPFSSGLQSFPASESFQMSQLFASRGQSTGVSAFTISPSNGHSRLISFRMDWLDLLAVQGTLKSLLQYHSSKASILFFFSFFFLISWRLITLQYHSGSCHTPTWN